MPGTPFRIGLDPIIGLVPGLGDVAGAVLSGYIITIGARLGAPPLVLIRMIGNVAIDMAIGSIPLLGDLFDFGWKANTRNLALIERFCADPAKTHRSTAILVGATIGTLAVLAAGSMYLAIMALKAILSVLE